SLSFVQIYSDFLLIQPHPHTYPRFPTTTLFRSFRPRNRILKLGCGTGRDAVPLARRGIRVDATDVSPAMTAATRARVLREDLSDLVCRLLLEKKKREENRVPPASPP